MRLAWLVNRPLDVVAVVAVGQNLGGRMDWDDRKCVSRCTTRGRRRVEATQRFRAAYKHGVASPEPFLAAGSIQPVVLVHQRPVQGVSQRRTRGEQPARRTRTHHELHPREAVVRLEKPRSHRRREDFRRVCGGGHTRGENEAQRGQKHGQWRRVMLRIGGEREGEWRRRVSGAQAEAPAPRCKPERSPPGAGAAGA